MNTYERGLDKLSVGQLLVLSFPSPIDEDCKGAALPAVILEKKQVGSLLGDWTYTVGFWTKWHSGKTSGLIVIKDLAVWRYFKNSYSEASVSNDPEEGIPPLSMLESINECENTGEYFLDHSFGITNKELFYVTNYDKDPQLAIRHKVIQDLSQDIDHTQQGI